MTGMARKIWIVLLYWKNDEIFISYRYKRGGSGNSDYIFYEIEETLSAKMKCPVISLEDILFGL